MRQTLAPLLFAEDDLVDPALRRGSPVAPAQPSARAERKAATKRSSDDQPVHHFRGLLDHLATLTKNTIQPQAGLPTFDQLTAPTPLQKRGCLGAVRRRYEPFAVLPSPKTGYRTNVY